MVRHPTRLASPQLLGLRCLLACCLLAAPANLLICCALCCAVLCCSLRRTDALLRVVPARCTAEATSIRCGCKSMQLQMQMQMQMHGRATARLALVPTDQVDAVQPRQISAQRTPKGCGPGTLGKASGRYSQPRDSRLGVLWRFRPLWPVAGYAGSDGDASSF